MTNYDIINYWFYDITDPNLHISDHRLRRKS